MFGCRSPPTLMIQRSILPSTLRTFSFIVNVTSPCQFNMSRELYTRQNNFNSVLQYYVLRSSLSLFLAQSEDKEHKNERATYSLPTYLPTSTYLGTSLSGQRERERERGTRCQLTHTCRAAKDFGFHKKLPVVKKDSGFHI